jgi:thiopurine S-methyltransferase
VQHFRPIQRKEASALTHTFWIERWKKGEIGFHRDDVHDFLPRHWPLLGVEKGQAVLVPLCGKSRDMVWLAAAGHPVVGVELSPLAVDDFFREQDLEADTTTFGSFVVRRAGPYTIWCGDFFDLPNEAVAGVAAAYDRAALVALPSSLQPRYADKLTQLLPPGSPTLLISLWYPEGEMAGPPFSTPLAQVAALFGTTHAINIAESRDGLPESQNIRDRGVTMLDEAAYVLRRKAV